MRNLSPGTLIVGIFAVLFGLVAAYVAKDYMQEQEAEAAAIAEPVMTRVPMAVADLPAERTITKDDIMTVPQTDAQLKDYEQFVPYMVRPQEIIGRTLSRPMPQGAVFEVANLYPVGVGPDLAERLEEGERAVTIPFTGSIAQTGLVKPGAIVDVLFRTQENGKEAIEETTLTLLEQVRVLAVGEQTFQGASGTAGGSVTLAVSALQARALKVVEDRGSLTLVLRNGEDDIAAETSGPTTLGELLGKRPGKPFSTEIYRRGRLTTVTHGAGEPIYVHHDTPYGMPVTKQVPAAQAPATTDQVSVRREEADSMVAGGASWAPAQRGRARRPASPLPIGANPTAVEKSF